MTHHQNPSSCLTGNTLFAAPSRLILLGGLILVAACSKNEDARNTQENIQISQFSVVNNSEAREGTIDAANPPPGNGATTDGQATNVNVVNQYQCADGSGLQVRTRVDGDRNWVEIRRQDGRILKLDAQPAASGTRYADDDHEFWSKGDHALWTDGEKPRTNCKDQAGAR